MFKPIQVEICLKQLIDVEIDEGLTKVVNIDLIQKQVRDRILGATAAFTRERTDEELTGDGPKGPINVLDLSSAACEVKVEPGVLHFLPNKYLIQGRVRYEPVEYEVEVTALNEQEAREKFDNDPWAFIDDAGVEYETDVETNGCPVDDVVCQE